MPDPTTPTATPPATAPAATKAADSKAAPPAVASTPAPITNVLTTWHDEPTDLWQAQVNARTFTGRNPPEAIGKAVEYVSSTSYAFDRTWTPSVG